MSFPGALAEALSGSFLAHNQLTGPMDRDFGIVGEALGARWTASRRSRGLQNSKQARKYTATIQKSRSIGPANQL